MNDIGFLQIFGGINICYNFSFQVIWNQKVKEYEGIKLPEKFELKARVKSLTTTGSKYQMRGLSCAECLRPINYARGSSLALKGLIYKIKSGQQVQIS